MQLVEANEPIGTSAVADECECSQLAAYKRLSKLTETGEITTDLIGGNRIWMRGETPEGPDTQHTLPQREKTADSPAPTTATQLP